MAQQRIAILGGGMAALTCAFEITNAPGWQNDYDVTVYQLGWRLGGKGASGRNAEVHDRIEEHGLHILLGFYENAFKVLKAAYGELGRPPGAPLATWQDAFKPHSYVVLMQPQPSWTPWVMNFPTNSDEPGTGGVLPTPWAMIQMMLGWLKQLFVSSPRLPDTHEDLDEARVKAASRDNSGVLEELYELHEWLHQKDHVNDGDIDWLRDYVTVDLGVAAIKGMIEDGVVKPPYDYFKLDSLDFRAWLSKYGAKDVSVNSAYITGMYDLGFSLEGQVGAGTALNGILRMCWTYKGAVMWKMQAGMGDTIFGPLYEVLKNRGVKFEFFSRVDNLVMSPDGAVVDKIEIGRQMAVKGGAAYDPLVPVKGLPCWPSEPQYAQLERGEELKASGECLEDWWTAWPDAGKLVLQNGVDFDRVVLGCSIGIFPYIAQNLMKASPQLAEMVGAIGTTQTQAAQLWHSCDLAGLGWTLDSPVLDGYAEPMDTWADMSHLLVREDWGDAVKNLAYLCSPLPDDTKQPVPRDQHGYAQKQNARVKANAVEWLTKSATGIWPKWDWSLLVGSTAQGPARFDSQYWLATWNPSDRYVLALPQTVDKRLGADGAGIANLVMAGDYLRTGMNVGCVEAATMGGMHASRAICGRPEVIVGDDTSSFAMDEPDDDMCGPTYIERGGDLCMSPALELTSTTMYSFLVGADKTALQKMCDEQLNAVTSPLGIYYKPLMPMVSIVCANIAKSYSLTPPDSQKGWMAERDFGIWVPVVKYEGGKPGRIGWYLPYVFVDNVAAMVTGREVFGFFKQTANLVMPDSPSGSGPFTIDALAIEKYSPASEAKMMRLLSMTSVTGAAAKGAVWNGAKDAAEAVWGAVRKSSFAPSLDLLWDLVKNMTEDLVTGDVPMVFLKQFRDASNQDRACYQAVIEAPAHLQKWHNGGFVNPHDIVIAPADSHPIVQECGLAGPKLRADIGFWTQMDFVMQPGVVVAEKR